MCLGGHISYLILYFRIIFFYMQHKLFEVLSCDRPGENSDAMFQVIKGGNTGLQGRTAFVETGVNDVCAAIHARS